MLRGMYASVDTEQLVKSSLPVEGYFYVPRMFAACLSKFARRVDSFIDSRSVAAFSINILKISLLF